MPLKNFILQESLKAEHAERFLLYVERYHSQIFHDLKKSLEASWKKHVDKLVKTHKISTETVQDLLLQNPNATTKIALISSSEKVSSSRFRETIEVSPSIKIPLSFSSSERDFIINSFLNEAEKVLKDLTQSWSEIFKIERKGKAVPWFKILNEQDEVRLQLSLSTETQEVYKTLYSIRVEYGKIGSKLKDFDRIYLISLIK